MNKALLNEAFSNYPKKWADYLTENDKKLYTLKVDRGFFTDGAVMADGEYYAIKFPDYATKYVSIHMSGLYKTTPYHEIGHYVEFFNKDAERISKEFLKARTKNEKLIKLTDLFPGESYRSNEMVKPDDFISPYIGKEYDYGSEVLSMGLQSIFEPMKLLKKESFINGQYEKIYATIKNDIEYLYLIIGLIIKA